MGRVFRSVVGQRGRLVGCAASIAVGCQFRAAGNNEKPLQVGDATEGTTAGDDEASDTAGETIAAPDDGDPMDSGPEGGDTQGNAGMDAHLVFVDPTTQLGDLVLDGSVITRLIVRNDGDGVASAITGTISAPLAFEGGAFPGTTGSCGAQLGPGQTCEIAIASTTGTLGPYSRDVTVHYLDNLDAENTSLLIHFGGVGQTGNLLMNGGAENGAVNAAVPSWENMGGEWYAWGSVAQSGSASIFAGSVGAVGSQARLRQDVDLSMYAEAIDSGMIAAAFSGFCRAYGDGDDPIWYRLANLDATNVESVEAESSPVSPPMAWAPISSERILPPGTRGLRVELFCQFQAGTVCSGWFDTLEVHLRYPAS